MTKIALTAAALLIATGSAFAGSDVYGNHGERNSNLPAVTAPVGNIDHGFTASIRGPVSHRDVTVTPDQNWPVAGHGLWGN